MKVPQRIQASRQHKEPTNCRRVCRPSKYGNINRIVKVSNDCYIVDYPSRVGTAEWLSKFDAHKRAVEFYDLDMNDFLYDDPAYYDNLLNYDYISCFCPLSLPCHCDAIIRHLEQRIKVLMAQTEFDKLGEQLAANHHKIRVLLKR